jgi:NhaP-type Na+/H+ or K+/H+ antiporter
MVRCARPRQAADRTAHPPRHKRGQECHSPRVSSDPAQAGLCVGTSALKLVNIHLENIAAERFCELALVFLLFSDSTRIDLAGLRRHLGWPSRLLLIGLD